MLPVSSFDETRGGRNDFCVKEPLLSLIVKVTFYIFNKLLVRILGHG
jgi:hypothetical protein